MRVTKKGDLNLVTPWFHQTPWVCPHCGCEFETDRTDWVANVLSNRNEDIKQMYCPTCRGIVTKDRSDVETPAKVDKTTAVRYARGNVPT